MINRLFTWLRPGGALTHQALSPLVSELFLGGLPAVDAWPAGQMRVTPPRGRGTIQRGAARDLSLEQLPTVVRPTGD